MSRLSALCALACLLVAGCGQPAPATTPPTTASTTAPAKDDPTAGIEGVESAEFQGVVHVDRAKRVAYRQSPPFGGSHDAVWAACNGVVYPVAIRTETMVHSLEHGAVWISYAPGLAADQLKTLVSLVDGKPYLMLSPYPGQDRPVSAQAWGRQLKVDSADDPRIVKFIAATRTNPHLSPEPGARCDAVGAPHFDQDHPPLFDPAPLGPDAAPVSAPPTVDVDQTPVP